jgi:hypothetical protein
MFLHSAILWRGIKPVLFTVLCLKAVQLAVVGGYGTVSCSSAREHVNHSRHFPFDCTGPNPDFNPKSVIIQKGSGHCASTSHSLEGTKGYRELWDGSDSDGACYNWYNWDGIRCWD